MPYNENNPQGYGPANAGYPASQASPTSAYSNDIRYQDMIQARGFNIQNSRVHDPMAMPLEQHKAIVHNSSYNFGVEGGQDAYLYNKRAELNTYGNIGTASMIATGAAAWELGDLAGISINKALGFKGAKFFGANAARGAVIKGTLIRGALGMGVSGALASIAQYGIENRIHQKTMQASISKDIYQYKDNIGLKAATPENFDKLGSRMYNAMGEGGFFGVEGMDRIHKLALSNNMLSAIKTGSVNSGTIKQYEQNFKELTKTTEEIVKMLNTTIEGGMKVMKEMQGQGFSSLAQIRSQIQQTKGYGVSSGLGTSNMMQIGRIGAEATAGTPYTAATGSRTFQRVASNLAIGAKASPAMAGAIQNVGGIGNATSAVSGAMMNIMSSRMGDQFAAYVMDPKTGKMDQAKMEKLMSGKLSPYEVSQGAAATGYGLGTKKAMFDKFKYDMLNNTNNLQAFASMQFDTWRKTKPYANTEEAAWVFAGQYSNSFDQQNLLYQSLLEPSRDFVTEAGRSYVEDLKNSQRYGFNNRAGIGNNLKRLTRNTVKGVGDFSTAVFGGLFVDAPVEGAKYLAEGARVIGKGVAEYGNTHGLWITNMGRVGSAEDAYKMKYGLGNQATTAEIIDAFESGNLIPQSSSTGIDSITAGDMASTLSSIGTNDTTRPIINKLSSMRENTTIKQILKSNDLNEKQKGIIKQNIKHSPLSQKRFIKNQALGQAKLLFGQNMADNISNPANLNAFIHKAEVAGLTGTYSQMAQNFADFKTTFSNPSEQFKNTFTRISKISDPIERGSQFKKYIIDPIKAKMQDEKGAAQPKIDNNVTVINKTIKMAAGMGDNAVNRFNKDLSLIRSAAQAGNISIKDGKLDYKVGGMVESSVNRLITGFRDIGAIDAINAVVENNSTKSNLNIASRYTNTSNMDMSNINIRDLSKKVSEAEKTLKNRFGGKFKKGDTFDNFIEDYKSSTPINELAQKYNKEIGQVALTPLEILQNKDRLPERGGIYLGASGGATYNSPDAKAIKIERYKEDLDNYIKNKDILTNTRARATYRGKVNAYSEYLSNRYKDVDNPGQISTKVDNFIYGNLSFDEFKEGISGLGINYIGDRKVAEEQIFKGAKTDKDKRAKLLEFLMTNQGIDTAYKHKKRVAFYNAERAIALDKEPDNLDKLKEYLDVEDSGDLKNEQIKELIDLEKEKMNNEADSTGMREGSQGKGMDVGTHPKVINYWNNNWRM